MVYKLKSKIGILIVSLVIVLALSGCVKQKPNILVTNYPVEFIVKRLAGDRVNVSRLDDEGFIPQRAQIRADYKTVLESTDVTFIINELQPYYEVYRDEIYETEVIDLAALSTLYKFNRYTKVTVNTESHYVESAYYETPLLEDVNMYSQLDPLLWMEPLAMVSMASTIKEWLIVHYPEEKTLFETNYSELEVELTYLQAKYQALSNTKTPIKIASMTPSYGNWQKSFGIEVYPIVLSEYGELPSEELFSAIRARIEADGVQYIVMDDNLPEDYRAMYDRLRIELKLQEIKLNNAFTLTDEDINNDFDYITIMSQNLQTLEALID